ncbi:hypothetical protein GXW82_35470 [Streptacidiphilus sp. 4-A2]|nr:hypothetical protein [Streptacidiphilus sp. 4-A2]
MEQVKTAGRDWLLQCAINQATAVQLWQDDPAAPLTMATGRSFDAVVLSDRLGLETIDLISKHTLPFTPAMLDVRARKIALLLPPRSRRVFTTMLRNLRAPIENVHYLSEGGYLVIPGPRPEADSRHQWVTPPVCSPAESKLRTAAVALAVCQAAQNLDERSTPHSTLYRPTRILTRSAAPRRPATPCVTDHEWPEAAK